MIRAGAALASLPLVAALSGCGSDLVCAEGTYEQGDTCRAGVEPACGPGTALENGACVPARGEGGQCGTGTHLDGDTCVADVTAEGNAGRFSDVHLTEPAEFVAVADASLHNSFATGANLAFLGIYAPTEQGVRIYGGGGTRNADGTYSLGHATAFDVAATTGAGGALESAPFAFQLNGFGSSNPVALVATTLRNVRTRRAGAVLLIDSASLSGVLTPGAADAVFIDQANSTLRGLLESFGVEPSVDLDGNGTAESWRLSLSIGTTPVWVF